MPAQLSPSAVSRDSVIVELRNRTSISPDCKAVNRDCAVSGTYRVLVASPNMAAAVALHRSTSRPVHTPALSGIEKPTSPVLTPQITAPPAFTASNVGPASAGPLVPRTREATAAPRIVHMPRIGPSSLLTIRPPVSGGPSSADRRDGRVHSPAQTIRDLIQDRKSTRLNSSHQIISYAVFCLKKKKKRFRGLQPRPAHEWSGL